MLCCWVRNNTLRKQKWIESDHPSGFRGAASGRWEQEMRFLAWAGWCDMWFSSQLSIPRDFWCLLARACYPASCHPPVHTLGWLFLFKQTHIFWIFLADHKIHFKAAHCPFACPSLAWGQTVTPTTPRLLRVEENVRLLHSDWFVAGCLHGWLSQYS